MAKTLATFVVDRPCVMEVLHTFIKPEDWESRKKSLATHSLRAWLFSKKGFERIPLFGMRTELHAQAKKHGLNTPRSWAQILKTKKDNEALIYYELTHEAGWIFRNFKSLTSTVTGLFDIRDDKEHGDEDAERVIPLWIRAKESGGKTTVFIEENYLVRRAIGGCFLFWLLSMIFLIPGIIYFFIRCFERQATKRFAREVLAPVLEARLREEDGGKLDN